MKTHIIAIALLVNCAALVRGEITLKVADANVPAGREAEVVVLISGSKTVGPLQFLIDYDPRLLEAIGGAAGEDPKGVRFGKVVSGGMIAEDLGESGEWRLALRTDEPITQDGELLRLRFKVKGKKGESCTLLIDAAEAWEKESLFEVGVKTQPGTLNIVASTLPRWAAIAVVLAVLAVLASLLLVGAVLLVRRRGKDGAVAATHQVPPPLPTGEDATARLRKLKEMQEAGLISTEEFEKRKNQLLDQI